MQNTENSQTGYPRLTLVVFITNGAAARDTRLRFEVSHDEAGVARFWLIKLPPLKNYDSFPRPIKSGTWELRLEVLASTQPLEIANCARASAQAWLHKIQPARPHSGTAELLILADQKQFTIAIKEF